MTNKRNRDVPGNAMASQEQFNKAMLRQASAINLISGVFDRWDDRNFWIESVVVRAPTIGRASWLVIGRAMSDNGRVVAFHDAPTFAEAVVGWCERALNETLKWTEDKYGN